MPSESERWAEVQRQRREAEIARELKRIEDDAMLDRMLEERERQKEPAR